ncbi:AAA family ATPase [Candidatus Woesearchaeota archaeon]|nr:AAA family ATPase [Candidatus Woesearchaeota archaeon]
MHNIIAIVGMPGAGKSTAAESFVREGWAKVRFGDVTMDELKSRDIPVCEENESVIRETLRLELGMDAYAKLNEPKIANALKRSDVVIDGLYSWQEYLYLKPKFQGLVLLAVYASPETRYRRLAQREERPLTRDESVSRDYSEIENLHKTETIAMAGFTVINEGSKESLRQVLSLLIRRLGSEK